MVLFHKDNFYRLLFFTVLILVVSFVLVSSICSATTEIVIEYNVTGTTTTIPSSTTLPTGTTIPSGGGGPGGEGGGTPEGPFMTYKIFVPLVTYVNETTTMKVEITNPSSFTLHNVGIEVSGLPPNSYTIATAPIRQLSPSKIATFFVDLNNSALMPAVYTIRWFMKSDETNATSSTNFELKSITREQAQQAEVAEEMKKAKPIIGTLLLALMIIIAGSSGIVVFTLYFHFKNRCGSCGGDLKKTYSGTNYTEFTCKKCGQKQIKTKSEEVKEEKSNV